MSEIICRLGKVEVPLFEVTGMGDARDSYAIGPLTFTVQFQHLGDWSYDLFAEREISYQQLPLELREKWDQFGQDIEAWALKESL